MLRTHKDLDVWKNSVKLVTDIYRISEDFPKSEVFGLVSQVRRSAVSIPSNIAEGAARLHNKEFTQFLNISMGSLAELETQLIISHNLAYISSEDCDILINQMNLIRSQLLGLIKYNRNKQ